MLIWLFLSHEYSSKDVPVGPLVSRIRDLEHALATLQATYHITPHPLLRKDLREIATSSTPSPPSPLPADDVNKLSENLGTLSMTGYGRSRFYGPSGGTWVSFYFSSSCPECTLDIPFPAVYMECQFSFRC